MSDDTKKVVALMKQFKLENDLNDASVTALLTYLQSDANKAIVANLQSGGKGDKKLIQLLEEMISTNDNRNKTVQEFQNLIKGMEWQKPK